MSKNNRTPAGLAATTGVQSQNDAWRSQFSKILPKSPDQIKAMESALNQISSEVDAKLVTGQISEAIWAGFERLIQAGQALVGMAQEANSNP
jgi:hypothetical protein